MEFLSQILKILKLLAGPTIGFIFGYLIAPWISEKFRLKTELVRVYLLPFKKWCADFYGEVYEFKKRYLEKKSSYDDLSSIQIIDDFREMHERMRFAPKWLAKIGKKETGKKDKEKVKMFWKLLNDIDCFWHNLEDERELPYLKDTEAIIEKLKKPTRDKVKEDIIKFIKENQDDLNKKIDVVLRYTKKEIP